MRTVLFWLAGGLEGRGYEHLGLAAAFVLPGSLALLLLARPLDVLSLGEEEAAALSLPVHGVRHPGLRPLRARGGAGDRGGGVRAVRRPRRAPRAARRSWGRSAATCCRPPSWRAPSSWWWPTSPRARFGQYVELPLGSVTAFVGAPYFLLALRGQEGRG